MVVSESHSQTSITLLGRLRLDPTDQGAWVDFVRRYGPKVYSWCKNWNLLDADAQDVSQNVLLLLADKMRTFEYDSSGSFRGWLRKVTRHAWNDFRERQQRAGAGAGGNRVQAWLDNLPAPDDLIRSLEEQFDCEILEEAKARVQLRLAPQTWEAFRLTAVEGLTAAEVAKQIPMRVAMVFVAKSRVLKMLSREIQILEGSSEN